MEAMRMTLRKMGLSSASRTSDLLINGEEWIIFSAESNSERLSINISSIEDIPPEALDSDIGDEADSLDAALSGHQTPAAALARVNSKFSFPHHDGAGTFTAAIAPMCLEIHEESSRASTICPVRSAFSSAELTARINAWRLDQSEQLCKTFANSATDGPVSPTRSDVSDFLSDDYPITTYDLLTLENATLNSDNSDLDGSQGFKLAELLTGHHKSSTTSSISCIESDMGSNKQQYNNFWQRLSRRVIQNLIGLDDNVLGVLLGEQFVESSFTKSPCSVISLRRSSKSNIRACRQDNININASSLTLRSPSSSNSHWEESLIARFNRRNEGASIFYKDFGSISLFV
ncbi:uncharacterized protein V1510DRAFT_409599 [Dipodascopsis tothii]|uniref:uncharacterized protein n=1 Tax=Dipodascopsis tothii TaxID=44089 RepID=UPI0034CD7667